MTCFPVFLSFDIVFHDSDEGDCIAGQGQKILSVFNSESDAISFIKKWNPILAVAEKETIIFPIQKYNKILKGVLGFTLFEMSQDNVNYKLAYEEIEIK